jgi:hypothetical protein
VEAETVSPGSPFNLKLLGIFLLVAYHSPL